MNTPNARVRERDGFARSLLMLRRRWLLVVGTLIACLAVAVIKHEHASKSYAATASVAFQSGTLSDSALQVSPQGSTEPQREADTEVLIARSPEVAEAVRSQLGIRASATQLLSQIGVEAAANADVLDITATTGEPADSARLANAFARAYIAFRGRSELAGIEAAQTSLESQLSALPAGSLERTSLQQTIERLGELRAVAGSGATVIGLAGTPTHPTGTSLTTSIVLGLLIGAALAFSLVLVLETLDQRIKSIEEFEQEYRLPALAGVPQSSFRTGPAADRAELLEPYRILRSALDFSAVTHRLDTLMITSAGPGDGKTTVSVDLAHVIALTGRRVVLVELDLRRPSFSQHFDLNPRLGVTTALVGEVPYSELLVSPIERLPNFSVLPAGLLPHNPSELLGSERVGELLTALRGDDGMVILDAPPLNPVADAQVLLGSAAVSAVLVVGRIGRTRRDEARRARAILSRHMVEPVGMVVTGLRDAARYGYEAYSSRGEQIGAGAPQLLGADGRRAKVVATRAE